MENKKLRMAASALVKTGAGKVVGIIVSSHTSGTIKLWDSLTAANTVILDTVTLGAGERFIPLYDTSFDVGLFVTIGGTAVITVVYN